MTGDDAAGSDRRAVLWGAAALVVAFAAGMGAGILITDRAEPPTSAPPPALFDDLDLTAEQQARVDSVLTATRERAGTVLEETRLDLTTLATDALQTIDRVLTPEQIDTVRARVRRWQPPAEPTDDREDP